MPIENLFATITLSLSMIALALTLLNAATIWRPLPAPQHSSHEGSQGVAINASILLPMRNEAKNVEALISSISGALRQEAGGIDWEVIALDDQSNDETFHLLSQSQSTLPQLRVLRGLDPEAGWLGKPAAQHRLYLEAKGEFLIFIDSDVRIEPGSITAAIKTMEHEDWDFISPYPRQIALTFLERLIQPLLQWSWFASVPLRLAARYRINSMAVANGQLFIVKRSALATIDGFASVKSEILEDIEIARRLWSAGLNGSVVDGSALAHCRMYEGSKALIDGYGKSLWRAFGSPFGATIAITIMIATSWLPLVMGLSGNAWGWIAFFAISLSRLVAALRTRSFWQSFLLHPISVALLSYMIVRSFILKRKGALTWRDRSIAL